jgi:hypothetical protein
LCQCYSEMTCGVQAHSCAISIGGAVLCWGHNAYGQVMLFDALQQTVVCCGKIYFGLMTCIFAQLGDSTSTNRLTPTAVVGLSSGVVMISLAWVRLM